MPAATPPSRRAPRRDRWFQPAVALGAAALIAGSAQPASASAAATTAKPSHSVLLPSSDRKTRVAAGGGHVVLMQGEGKNRSGGPSTIYEVTEGAEPRPLATVKGGLAWPELGTDAKGRAVVIVSPCLVAGRATPLPACNLSAIDLETGRATVIPHSKGAYIGDLDHGRGVVARRSASVGVRVALLPTQSASDSRPLPFGAALPDKLIGWYSHADTFVDSLDLSNGTIAASALWGMANGGDGGGSALLRRSVNGGSWTQLAHTTYGGASGILRVFRGVTVTSTGVRALYDGGDNAQSYVARWSSAGKIVRQRNVDLSILDSAGFDGDRLVAVGASVLGCEDGDTSTGCAVVETGPLGLG